jgi:hypothetical protein
MFLKIIKCLKSHEENKTLVIDNLVCFITSKSALNNKLNMLRQGRNFSLRKSPSKSKSIQLRQALRYSRPFAQYTGFSGETSLLTQTLLIEGYFDEIIATNILHWSSQSGWPLRNTNFSNDNEPVSFYVDIFLTTITDNTLNGANNE